MKLKKGWKRFWTLNRHHADGFTLVELIVVIAILAILAGVGSVGYSGYIKNANKNNDKVLVGNIMRAIETGTYSTMFVPSESLQISATSYPVGFVVLSTDGTNLLTSGTKITKVEGECVFEEIENVLVETTSTKESGCYSNESGVITSVSAGTIRYCATHSPTPDVVSATGEYISDYTHSGEDKNYYVYKECKNHTWTAVKTPYPVNSKKVSNQSALYAEKSGGLCELAYANQNGIYTGENKVNGGTDADGNQIPVDTTHPLYTAIQAAYGDLSSLKLSYDGWTADEGIDFATFYSGASGVMDSVDTLSEMLITIQDLLIVGEYVDGDYESQEDFLSQATDTILTTHPTVDSWLTKWNAAGNSTWDTESFGLAGRENYSAARSGYNAAFATYLAAKGVDNKYCEIIRNYNRNEVTVLGKTYGLPGLVCSDTFTDTESGLEQKFKDVGDDTASETSEFKKVFSLYEEYKGSTVCEENGRVFYETLVTLDETEEFASDKNNIYGGDVFAYYKAYTDEISALYSEAQKNVKDGSILIIVSVKDNDNDGTLDLDFQVSPSAANPRND